MRWNPYRRNAKKRKRKKRRSLPTKKLEPGYRGRRIRKRVEQTFRDAGWARRRHYSRRRRYHRNPEIFDDESYELQHKPTPTPRELIKFIESQPGGFATAKDFKDYFGVKNVTTAINRAKKILPSQLIRIGKKHKFYTRQSLEQAQKKLLSFINKRSFLKKKDLSKYFGMTQRGEKAAKDLLGYNIQQHQQEVRKRRAQSLCRNTPWSNRKIADRVGGVTEGAIQKWCKDIKRVKISSHHEQTIDFLKNKDGCASKKDILQHLGVKRLDLSHYPFFKLCGGKKGVWCLSDIECPSTLPLPP
jgi:hypothetical protein